MTIGKIHEISRQNAIFLDNSIITSGSYQEAEEKLSFSSSIKALQIVELQRKTQAALQEQKKTKDVFSRILIQIGETFQATTPRCSNKKVQDELIRTQAELIRLRKDVFKIDDHNINLSPEQHVQNELTRLSSQLVESSVFSRDTSEEINTQINNLATTKAKKRIEQSTTTGATVTFVAIGVLATLYARNPSFPNEGKRSFET